MSTKQTDILENLYEGVYFVDKDRTITSWNNGASDITGFESKEVVHKKCYENILNHVDINGVALCFEGCPLHATIEDGIAREANVFLQHKNGHRVPVKIKALPIYNNEGGIVGAVEIFNEIKEERDIKNDLIKLQTEASQDELTQVPNRKYLNAIIESKIREFKAVNVSFGINFIDIDNFKHINDTYGHGVGDDVLKLLVQTIQANLRKNDVIGRLGGEEFIILLPETEITGACILAEKLRSSIENHSFYTVKTITSSFGVTELIMEEDYSSFTKRVDDALYNAKNNGRNKVSKL